MVHATTLSDTAPIDWHDGNPDAAFAEAAARALPLVLYWGARWCPACNRLTATVLERADFQALAPAFVALRIDGDDDGAQRLAERFHVRNYPSLVVYRPDGAEITRLPHELDGERMVQVMKVALYAQQTVAESLTSALGGGRALSDDEWRLLSCHAWDSDERRLIDSSELAATMARVARDCTLPDAALRLQWHTLLGCLSDIAGVDTPTSVERVETMLADAQAVRSHIDIVTHGDVDWLLFMMPSQTPAALHLAQCWATALARLEDDAALNCADQLAALRTRGRMARKGAPIEGIAAVVRERVARALQTPCSAALRHYLVNTAAGVLSDEGRLHEAEQLLLDELGRSHAPFYFMHSLAAIARKRGDAAATVNWCEQGWDNATGSATRLQWGATYLQNLCALAPRDPARIDRCASALLQHMKGMHDAACQRNRTQLTLIAGVLATWRDASLPVAALKETVAAVLRN